MARVQILCQDSAVLAALKEMEASGKAYGGHLRRADLSDDELEALRERNKAAIEALATASARVVQRRLGAV
jgi:hypothetical protein